MKTKQGSRGLKGGERQFTEKSDVERKALAIGSLCQGINGLLALDSVIKRKRYLVERKCFVQAQYRHQEDPRRDERQKPSSKGAIEGGNAWRADERLEGGRRRRREANTSTVMLESCLPSVRTLGLAVLTLPKVRATAEQMTVECI